MQRHSKSPVLILRPQRNYQRELEALYARRSALDAVIASLEVYDRFRARTPRVVGERKSA